MKGAIQFFPSPDLTASDLASAGMSALVRMERVVQSDRGGNLPETRFDEHHIVLNAGGDHKTTTLCDGVRRTFVCVKGQVLFTPAGTTMSMVWDGRANAVILHIDPDRLDSFADLELGVHLDSGNINGPLHFDAPSLVDLALRLSTTIRDPGVGSRLMFEAYARVFLVELVRGFGDLARPIWKGRGLEPDIYGRVMAFVSENIGGPIGVSELADLADMSQTVFSRRFRITTGQSPKRFITQCRVDAAKERLGDQNISLSQIALECGFADQPHFSRVFKRLTGSTPTAYRASLLEQDR